jgi:hypothetical protein
MRSFITYTLPNIVRRMKSRRMGKACSTCGRGVHAGLVGRPEGKNSLKRPGLSWEDIIKMNLTEIGLGACTGFILFRIGISG